MQKLLGELSHAGDGDTVALLDGERVVGGLELDQRAEADGLDVDLRAERERGFLGGR